MKVHPVVHFLSLLCATYVMALLIRGCETYPVGPGSSRVGEVWCNKDLIVLKVSESQQAMHTALDSAIFMTKVCSKGR